MSTDKNVLFVCVENAGWGQIAEAFFKKYFPKEFKVISAGIILSSQLNSLVVKVMKEIRIKLDTQQPKLSNKMIENSFKTVNIGCMDKESCPSLFAKDMLDWNISDPKEKSIDGVRTISDQIKNKVMNLFDSLKEDN